ncbi:hypothetical protein JCM10207_005678 [Rhodosporidiobolus poonsookiae]
MENSISFMQLLQFVERVPEDYPHKLTKPEDAPGWILPSALSGSTCPFPCPPPTDIKALRQLAEDLDREQEEEKYTPEERAERKRERARREKNKKKKERKLRSIKRKTAEAEGGEGADASTSSAVATSTPTPSRSSSAASYGLSEDFPPETHRDFAERYAEVLASSIKMRGELFEAYGPQEVRASNPDFGNIIYHVRTADGQPQVGFAYDDEGRYELHLEG